MHYYKRNLGDYAKKAGRLSMLQHGAYTLLIDACYDREQFPTLEEAIEWSWASTTEEEEAVKFVLRKFFTLEGDVYVQKRIQEEIAEYHSKAETNKRIAIEREANRKEKTTNRERAVNEPTPNHKPITNNQEPITNNIIGATNVAPKKTNGCRFSKDQQLDEEWILFCKKNRPDLNPALVFEQFRDYWIAQPGQKGVKTDWYATWRNWVRNQKQGTKQVLSAEQRLEETKRLLGFVDDESEVIDV